MHCIRTASVDIYQQFIRDYKAGINSIRTASVDIYPVFVMAVHSGQNCIRTASVDIYQISTYTSLKKIGVFVQHLLIFIPNVIRIY